MWSLFWSVAGSSSGGYSYISEFHTSSTAARAAAFVSIALSAVWVLMSPLALIIIPQDWSFNISILEYKPWRFFLTCTSLVNLWNIVAFSFLPESPKFLLAMDRKAEALQVLSRIYAFNTGKPKEVILNDWFCKIQKKEKHFFQFKNYPVKIIESVSLSNNLSDAKGVCGFLNLVVLQTKPIFQKPLFTNTWKLCFIIFVMFSIGHGTFMW